MIKGSLQTGTILLFRVVCRQQFLTFDMTEDTIIITGDELKITITRNEQNGRLYDFSSESTRANLQRQKKSALEASQIQGRVLDLIHAYKADSLQRRRKKLT